MPLILAIDSDPSCQDILRNQFSSIHEISFFSHLRNLNSIAHKNGFDLAIINLEDDEPAGLKFLESLSSRSGAPPVIITSQKDDPRWIVRIIKAGAFDFISKPYSGEKIRLAVERALENNRLRNELDYLRRQQNAVYDLRKIIAVSPSMDKVMRLVEKYSATDSNLLITGETGTGKSYLAGSMHFNSPRRQNPFIRINCANIPETLLESELFGHERGAFTDAVKTRKGRLEQAAGGTVFLDEIGEMSLSLQSRLLRFVEDRSFERLGGNRTISCDVRIIAATNQDLAGMIKQGTFRRDLYYRLNVLSIHLPGLRHRKECLEPLARHCLEKISRDSGKKVMDISPRVLDMMMRYSWPGNIRELINVIERAVLLENGPIIRSGSVCLMEESDVPEAVEAQDDSRNLHKSEYDNIIKALEKNLWIQKKAALELGISPRALNYKIKKYGITHWSWRRHKK